MSLFLGDIHFWLYNKIILAEALEKDILRLAKEKGFNEALLKKESREKYGNPTEGKELETIIDTSNIHGWLQEKIANVETRQSFLVTQLVQEDKNNIVEIKALFANQGKTSANEVEKALNTPEEVFNYLNNFVIEGMPCDRVNEIIKSDEQEFVWSVTTCLHRPYWEKVSGDVEVFYILREAWVKAFVEAIKGGFEYERSGFTHTIKKS
ncbi:hypothetical protein EDC19_2283 [Natranaerovirga hydrolytica]|uniref:Uncharacterized protein n=1 Tax=Natranaerovirga hydrolytica TaxID=680378 RepID=A0A4R1MHB3_9FIRM|nr:hypothetical protein [Natranaerovirga hydrolytica]TCK90514.1 hypothetical protein EDC19_2283 [Natranaerovirga hydrolytica]